MKEIKRLNINKASLKGKIKTYNFPNCLKRAGFTPLHRKRENRQQGRVWTG